MAELVKRAVDAVLGERRFIHLAIGGGSPIYLSATQLEKITSQSIVFLVAQACS